MDTLVGFRISYLLLSSCLDNTDSTYSICLFEKPYTYITAQSNTMYFRSYSSNLAPRLWHMFGYEIVGGEVRCHCRWKVSFHFLPEVRAPVMVSRNRQRQQQQKA